MKKLITIAAMLLASVVYAQSFSSPESVEYDAAGNRWFVGQNGSGAIHIYSPASGTLIPFASGLASGPHGLEIMGNVLYACDGGYIRGFDLSNGSQVFSLNLNATFLNGLTTDGSTYLFATDFTAKKIYRICPSANTFNVMCTTVYTPNGIYYDGAANRCVFVNWGASARVQAMSLADSLVTTLYQTSVSNIDGITRDGAGYWYITTWGGNALRRFDPNFSTAPVSVMTGLSSPADIDINTAGDSIGIPNSGSANNVVFYTGITTGLPAHDIELGKIYPSIAVEGVTIELAQPLSNAAVEVYDMQGKQVRNEAFSGTTFFLLRKDLADGAYSIVILDGQGEFVLRRQVVFE